MCLRTGSAHLWLHELFRGSLKASCSALTCSRTCRRYPQSGLSPYLRISACPAYVCTAVQASLPICASAVRGSLKASCSALTCSRTCRRYPQSGLSPYLRISACPAYVCTAVQASLPICASAVRGFQRYIISGSFLVNNRKLASFLYSRGLISSSMVLRSLAMH